MAFQKLVRGNQAAAMNGTIVEAADTYKYIKKGNVMKGGYAHIGKFVVKDTTTGDYRGVKTGDSTFAGVCILDKYISGESMTSIYPEGTPISILENGVVAVSVNGDNNENDEVRVDVENGNIWIGTAGVTTATTTLVPNWTCVQHTGLGKDSSGIAFIKK